MEIQYRLQYDDPYAILAHAIVGLYRPADVLRMLTDNEYLLNCIIKETRALDIRGIFLDCIVEDVLAQKKRMELMRSLDTLAGFFYEHLDKKRLRAEIRKALSHIGVEIEEL